MLLCFGVRVRYKLTKPKISLKLTKIVFSEFQKMHVPVYGFVKNFSPTFIVRIALSYRFIWAYTKITKVTNRDR